MYILFHIHKNILYLVRNPGTCDHGLCLVAVFHIKHEFVPAKPDRDTVLSSFRPQDISNFLEYHVPKNPALLQVHILKSIHVQKHQDPMLARRPVRHAFLNQADAAVPVIKARKAVPAPCLDKRLLRCFLPCDVFHNANHKPGGAILIAQDDRQGLPAPERLVASPEFTACGARTLMDAPIHLIKSRTERFIHLFHGKAAGQVVVVFLAAIQLTGPGRNHAFPGIRIVIKLTGSGMLQRHMQHLIAGFQLVCETLIALLCFFALVNIQIHTLDVGLIAAV